MEVVNALKYEGFMQMDRDGMMSVEGGSSTGIADTIRAIAKLLSTLSALSDCIDDFIEGFNEGYEEATR